MRIFIVLVLYCLMAIHVGEAFAQTQTGFMNHGQSAALTYHGVCRQVSFNRPIPEIAAVAIPSADLPQWQSFIDNPPPGVTIAACTAACTGFSYGGYCYYFGGRGQSCDATCAQLGGCNAAGTIAIGSGAADNTPCVEVLEGMGAGIDTSFNSAHISGAGCTLSGDVVWRVTNPATTCAGTPWTPSVGQNTTPHWRACACNGQAPGTNSCALPWGGSIAHGQSVMAYMSNSSTDCTSLRDVRRCYNGVLTGSGTFQTCSPPSTAACVGQWQGGTVAHGASVTAYYATAMNNCGGQCDYCGNYSETRTCNNGTLSGSAWFSSCDDFCNPGQACY